MKQNYPHPHEFKNSSYKTPHGAVDYLKNAPFKEKEKLNAVLLTCAGAPDNYRIITRSHVLTTHPSAQYYKHIVEKLAQDADTVVDQSLKLKAYYALFLYEKDAEKKELYGDKIFPLLRWNMDDTQTDAIIKSLEKITSPDNMLPFRVSRITTYRSMASPANKNSLYNAAANAFLWLLENPDAPNWKTQHKRSSLDGITKHLVTTLPYSPSIASDLFDFVEELLPYKENQKSGFFVLHRIADDRTAPEALCEKATTRIEGLIKEPTCLPAIKDDANQFLYALSNELPIRPIDKPNKIPVHQKALN